MRRCATSERTMTPAKTSTGLVQAIPRLAGKHDHRARVVSASLTSCDGASATLAIGEFKNIALQQIAIKGPSDNRLADVESANSQGRCSEASGTFVAPSVTALQKPQKPRGRR